MMMMTKPSIDEVKVTCQCGCAVVQVLKEEFSGGDFISLSVYPSGFYSAQDGIFKIFFERVSMAWKILTGQKFYFYDLVLTKENARDLWSIFNRIKE